MAQKKKPLSELEQCEAFGYDAGMNGATLANCDFRIFSSREKTNAWKRGNERAIDEKKLISALAFSAKQTPKTVTRKKK